MNSSHESRETEYQENGVTGERERHHYKGSVTQTPTAGCSAHSKNYTCPTNAKSSQARLEAHSANYS